MSATLSIKEVNGASAGTPNTITNGRFCTTDAYNPGTTYPMVKPAAGSNYSYKKTIYLNADTPPSSIINNIKLYSDGSLGWTGITVGAKAVDSYAQATGTEGTTGDQLAGTTSLFSYTSGSPLSLTGSISSPNTGKVSQYVEMQAVVSTDAVAGAVATETLSFVYDEV